MTVIASAIIQDYLDTGRNGHTTAEQGRALEDLICYVLGQARRGDHAQKRTQRIQYRRDRRCNLE